MKMHTLSAEIRKDINNGYNLKVSVLDLGVYMDGWRATRTDRNPSGWWIQEPKYKVGNRYFSKVEFDKSKILWQEIEQAILDCLAENERNEQADMDAIRPPAAPDPPAPERLHFGNEWDTGTHRNTGHDIDF